MSGKPKNGSAKAKALDDLRPVIEAEVEHDDQGQHDPDNGEAHSQSDDHVVSEAWLR